MTGPVTGPGQDAVPLDGQVRVALAHACVQALAHQHGLDLLHVKGPALDPSLRVPHRTSSDADVLVRPAHVPGLTKALHDAGWRLVTGFRSGSVFEHAANFHHGDWGYVDVHRTFPGITRDPTTAFDDLWSERGSASLAHLPCDVPTLLDQALLLCLHAARGFDDERSRADLDLVWHQAGAAVQQQIRDRAGSLGAEVALAAAIGELDRYDDRTVALWRYFSRGGTRADEWRARLRAAPTWSARLSIAVRGAGVNREYAAMMLGHEPTTAELARLFAGRFATAGRLLVSRSARRTGPGDGTDPSE